MIVRVREFARRRWLDIALGLVAFAFAAPSLGYPLGRDHGLRLFVGRAWLEGRAPYKGTWDQDPPGLYLFSILESALFGGGPASIRIGELLVAPVLGILCAQLALRARVGSAAARLPAPDGVCGFAMLTVSVVYFGYFGFWDTAQGELVAVTALLAGLYLVLERPFRGAVSPLLAGVLTGAAVTMVPTAATFAIVPLVALSTGSRGSRRRALAAFVLGAAAPIALVTALLASKGALSDAYDLLYDARCLYRPSTLTLHTAVARAVEGYALMKPTSAILTAAVMLGAAFWTWRAMPDRRRGYLLALVLAACACASLVLRGKFYFAHWALITGPSALVASVVALDVVAWAAAKRRAIVLLAAHALFTYSLSAGSGEWLDRSLLAARRAIGAASPEDVDAAFRIDAISFVEIERSQVARWLRDNTAAADDVAIRGFEPDLYVLADRTYRGRFFFTLPLTTSACDYRRGEWLFHYDEEIARLRPRWVVARAAVHEGPDSAEFYAALGYTTRVTTGGFTVLERP